MMWSFFRRNIWFKNRAGSKKILALNTKTYAIIEVHSFKEPVYSYMQTAGLELVVLESGLYLL